MNAADRLNYWIGLDRRLRDGLNVPNFAKEERRVSVAKVHRDLATLRKLGQRTVAMQVNIDGHNETIQKYAEDTKPLFTRNLAKRLRRTRPAHA